MRRGSESLSRGAELLACQQEKLGEPPAFDLLIVGSGYGGAVAAARAAGCVDRDGRTQSIAVLERGLEYQSGDFPGSLDTLTGHVRYSGGGFSGIRGWRDGLFDVRLGEDVSALVANGLGGGSLINAGVAERADAATLADMAWPIEWRGDEARWDMLYRKAERGLEAAPWPAHDSEKKVAMDALARRMGASARPVHLTIRPPAGTSGHPGCIRCGDCFSGCNADAKRTLCTTYLKLARDGKVGLYTGATVLRISRDHKKHPWEVHWVFSDPKRLPDREDPFSVRAHRVVLAAGTFGSTEILARSQAPGLRFSSHLGSGFSTNGDVIGAQFGVPERVNAWARDNQLPGERQQGPTITHQIEIERDNSKAPARRMVVQDLTVPAALGWLFGEIITSLALPQRWTRFDWKPRHLDSPDPAVVNDAPGGPLDHTLLLTAFGHDGAAGKLLMLPGHDEAMHDGHAIVHWPGAGNTPFFHHADRRLLAAAQSAGADWLRNPMWQATPDSPLIEPPKHRRLLTVHPLGGCRMATDMMQGVVDPFGRVFDAGGVDTGGPPGRPGTAWAYRENRRVHDGLYVLDGSIVPTSLGINPLLTITALAEGITKQWLSDWGWRPGAVADSRSREQASGPAPQPVIANLRASKDFGAGAPSAIDPATDVTSVRFAERMSGLLAERFQPTDEQMRVRLNMTFRFGEIPDVGEFLRRKRKELPIKGEMSLVKSSWDSVKERQHDSPASQVVPFTGKVRWFEQQEIGVFRRALRTFLAWRQLRAAADLAQPQPGISEVGLIRWGASWVRRILAFLKMLTHFGAPRLLAYELVAGADLTLDEEIVVQRGARLHGEKSLVYEKDGNPWVQLTRLDLHLLRDRRDSLLTTLRYDELFMLGRDTLPLSVFAQLNGTSGLRDALSILLYAGRVIFLQHYLSFRRPDYAAHRPLRRLPWKDERKYPGLSFAVFDDIVVEAPAAGGPPIRLRLTRIRCAERVAEKCAPAVLLLHGFGSGGVQFTHPSIPAPMGPWLARRGHDVWVGELRTSIGLPTCRQQWVMDDIAVEDVPALVEGVRRLRHQLDGRPAQEPIDVVAHCIGSAMFCMAVLAGRLDGMIRRAVLMQVGPIVHLPRPSRVRGYVGNRLQKLFGLGMIEATVDDTASDSDETLDRILGTFPYQGPIVRWQIREQETGTRIGKDLLHNGRIANANRCAGVFAQLFQWGNMSVGKTGEALMDALPDLLGPCNLTTYQQTVQYAFLRRLTNQDGESAYVTDEQVKAHMGFPILFIQGKDNDVFAARGTHDSLRLLKRVFGESHPVNRIEIGGFGHLDCVVGIGAKSKVLVPIRNFLHTPEPKAAPAPRQDAPDFRAPSVGPWVGHVRETAQGATRFRIGLKVDDQRTPPHAIYSVVAVAGQPLPRTLWVHRTPLAPNNFPSVAGARMRCTKTFDPEGEAVIEVEVDKDLRCGEIWVCTTDGAVDRSSPTGFVDQWKQVRDSRPARAPRSGTEIPIDNVILEQGWLKIRTAEQPRLAFAVMACRQAPLLLDRALADAACESLLHENLHHVLMVGDQIYADALAASGGVDGTRLRYFDAHREAWTAPHQQALMQRMPVYMAADDHEYRDNFSGGSRNSSGWHAASVAMWRYQYAAGPRGCRRPPKFPQNQADYWYQMVHRGYHTFVCDTRNQRTEGPHVDGACAEIMGDLQFDAIGKWLKASRDSARPRFLVLPSPVVPLFLDAVKQPAYRVRCDNWQRFPASLVRLLGLLVDDGAEHLVLLSGDYHCYAKCSVTIVDSRDGRSVELRSATTTGVYCPYTMVNTERAELWESGDEAICEVCCGPYRLSYRIVDFRTGPGYTVVRSQPTGRIDIDFRPLQPTNLMARKAASPDDGSEEEPLAVL